MQPLGDMPLTLDSFAARFHSLEGPTIGAKKRNLNHLLQQIPHDYQDQVLTSIYPKNDFEKLLIVDIFLKFQRTSDLINVLRAGDEFLVLRILKNKQFCMDFANILKTRPEGFVLTLLPCMSYVSRLKLMHRLEKYGENLDVIYEQIEECYGPTLAFNILIGCSTEKINQILFARLFELNKIKLTPIQLKLLFKKHQKVFIKYVEFCKQNAFLDLDQSVLEYVAANDLQVFVNLLCNNGNRLYIHLGKRLTRKLIKKYKTFVVEKHPVEFIHALHAKTLFKTLTIAEYKSLHLRCFPREYSIGCNLLEYIYINSKNPKIAGQLAEIAYQIIEEGIEKKWKSSISDISKIIPEKLIRKLDPVKREKLMKLKAENEEEYNLKYRSISDSISTLKRKIDLTSDVDRRHTLLISMIETCEINNYDLESLVGVLKYIFDRHRNDYNAIQQALTALKENFNLNDMSIEHWKLINTLLDFLKTKDSEYYYTYEFNIKYVEFLFRTGQSITPTLSKIFTTTTTLRSTWEFETVSVDFKQILLIKLYELIPEIMGNLHHPLEYYDMRLFEAIVQWNRNSKIDNQISIFDKIRLFESFNKIVYSCDEEAFNEVGNIISVIYEYLLKLTFKEPKFGSQKERLLKMLTEKTNFTEIYGKLYGSYAFLLKHNPEFFTDEKAFEIFSKNVTKTYFIEDIYRILAYIKQYEDLRIKTVNTCCSFLKLPSNTCSYETIFTILALLMPDCDCLKIIKEHVPVLKNIQDVMEKADFVRNVIRGAVKSFKFTHSPLVLETLLDYTDLFLGEALESLYFLFIHCPQNQIIPIIDLIKTKKVSLRKHAIFLSCRIGNRSEVAKIFSFLINEETNASLLKHLFKAMYNYFAKNPSEQIWDFLQRLIYKLNLIDDSESLELIVNINIVPISYKTKYLNFIWNILNKQQHDVSKYKIKLLSRLDSDIFKVLTLEFITEIIMEFKLDDAGNNFLFSALSTSSHRTEIFDVIFRIILTFKNDENFYNISTSKSCDIVFNFVSQLISQFNRQSVAGDVEILKTFTERWNEHFTPTEAIEPYLQLSLSVLAIQFVDNFDFLTDEIAKLFKDCIEKYSTVIIGIFADILRSTLQDTFACYDDNDTNKIVYKIYLELLKTNKSDPNFSTLILHSLPVFPSKGTARELLFDIIQMLRDVDDVAIKMYLNFYLRKLKV